MSNPTSHVGNVEGFARSIQDLAEVFEVTPRTISRWIDAGAPGKTRAGYDLDLWSEWIDKNGRGVGRMLTSDEGLLAAQKRLTSAKADREELRLERERGLVVEKSEADRQRMRMCLVFAGLLDRFASELPLKIKSHGKSARSAYEKYFNGIRQELAERPNWPVPDGPRAEKSDNGQKRRRQRAVGASPGKRCDEE